MTPDFAKNHFALFGFPVAFELDLAALERAYLNVQREVHPDKFANASDAEKRLAAQWTINANVAFKTLKSPLARGRYMLSLFGIDTEEESNTAMPVEFLMQQMEWREAVVHARITHDEASLDLLTNDWRAHEKALIAQLASELASEATRMRARESVRKLRFLEKLGEEIDLAAEAMDQ
jgi:molecular chaperone HscB